MASFEITRLGPGCPYSGFPSTTQHVTESKHGRFISYLSAQDNTAYAAQTLRVVWIKADGAVVELPTATGAPRIFASQAAAVETFYDTGELYAVWSDYLAGGIYVERWPDVTQSLTPIRTVISGAGTACGKFAALADEGARCLYFIGTSGYFFKITQDGALGYSQAVLNPATNPSYFVLTQDEDGKVYLVWNTANTVNGVVNYNSVMCLMSMNAHENTGAYWFPGRWGSVPTVAVPIVADANGPAVPALTGAQTRAMNNLLIHAQIADGGLLQIAYAQGATSGSRMFDADALRDCSVGLTALKWSDASALTHPETISKRPLRTRATMPRCASGGIFERESGLYFVGHDNAMNLVCLRSTDKGQNWKDFASTRVPAAPEMKMLHYVSGYRGWEEDTDIHGIVCAIATSPSGWSGVQTIPNFATEVFRWTLPLV